MSVAGFAHIYAGMATDDDPSSSFTIRNPYEDSVGYLPHAILCTTVLWGAN